MLSFLCMKCRTFWEWLNIIMISWNLELRAPKTKAPGIFHFCLFFNLVWHKTYTIISRVSVIFQKETPNWSLLIGCGRQAKTQFELLSILSDWFISNRFSHICMAKSRIFNTFWHVCFTNYIYKMIRWTQKGS